MVTTAMKLRHLLLERKTITNLESIIIKKKAETSLCPQRFILSKL